MDLAVKDIRRHVGKFVATIIGVGLLLTIVLTTIVAIVLNTVVGPASSGFAPNTAVLPTQYLFDFNLDNFQTVLQPLLPEHLFGVWTNYNVLIIALVVCWGTSIDEERTERPWWQQIVATAVPNKTLLTAVTTTSLSESEWVTAWANISGNAG